MKKMWRIVWLLCISSSLFANGGDLPDNLNSHLLSSGEINGFIYDAETGETLVGATVRITNVAGTIGTTTDQNGYYSLKPLQAGSYNLEFSFLGKTAQALQDVILASDQIVQLDAHLYEDKNLLGPVVITTYKVPLLEPGKPISVFAMSHKEIQKLPTRDVNSIVSAGTGIYQSDEGDGLNVRGARVGSTQYIIDGVKSSSAVGVPSSAIGFIQVITGGLPARYGDTTGGVVVIETRRY